MPIELRYLTWVTVLTALLWVPYILNEIASKRWAIRSTRSRSPCGRSA
jgi:hypothetical protein